MEIDNDEILPSNSEKKPFISLVMDAKNYSGGEERAEVNSKIIAYENGLHAEEGMLFFPNYPKDEFIKHFPNTDDSNRGYTRLRFSPSDKLELIKMRNETLEYILRQINKSKKIKHSI